MTEYDLFVKCIPVIAEMAVRCRTLDQQEYENFKCKAIESVDETAKEFVGKVLIVIDSIVLKGDTVNG